MQHYKYLFLIIDSDTEPVYASFREIIRKYMNTYPADIKAFFIRSSPTVSSPTIIGDTLYTHGEETFKPGIITKTINSMKYCLENYSFDFLIRTNMSSFWNYHYLLEKYTLSPKNNYVCAVVGCHDSIKFPSGCGFIMSHDVVVKCVDYSHTIDKYKYLDDVVIGQLLHSLGISITPGDRYDFTTYENRNMTEQDIINSKPSVHYHYRVRADQKEGDIHVHQLLYNAIYNQHA